MVAAEHAQAAAVDGQRLVQAELGAEIGNDVVATVGVRILVPGGRVGVHVGVEGGQYGGIALAVAGVGGGCIQRCLAHAMQELDGVVIDTLPQFGVNCSVEILRRRFPTPPQVVGQLIEAANGFGDTRQDGDGTNDIHRGIWLLKGLLVFRRVHVRLVAHP